MCRLVTRAGWNSISGGGNCEPRGISEHPGAAMWGVERGDRGGGGQGQVWARRGFLEAWVAGGDGRRPRVAGDDGLRSSCSELSCPLVAGGVGAGSLRLRGSGPGSRVPVAPL